MMDITRYQHTYLILHTYSDTFRCYRFMTLLLITPYPGLKTYHSISTYLLDIARLLGYVQILPFHDVAFDNAIAWAKDVALKFAAHLCRL